mgnify:CR=1 FL=1|tara:strand:- start:359 stop:1063 length:705 start_codon:yes stop_codon:yes gene_type:complete
MNLNNTLIFTATYNEVENISKLIEMIISLKLNSDIYIIDDNSPDNTSEIIKSYSKKYPFISYKIRSGKLGLDTAHKEAFFYAKTNKYTKFITMDADLSHDPKELRKFISLLDEFPFVIGSRYMPGGKNNMTFLRLFLSYFGNQLIKKMLRLPSTEFTTSYRGFNLEKLNKFDFNSISSKGYSFFMETIFRINRLGYQIKEIPIIFENRAKGKSKIPKIETLRTLKNIFILMFKK